MKRYRVKIGWGSDIRAVELQTSPPDLDEVSPFWRHACAGAHPSNAHAT
jgi:hypothetical protein